MRTAIVAVLCVGFAVGNPARADLDKGDYAPDIEAKEWMNTDEPISVIELRGMVVIVFFWVSWNPGGEYVMPLMSALNSKIGRPRGMFLLAVTDSDRQRVEEMLKKQIVQFPGALEAQDAFEDYDLTDLAAPRVGIIDANGKVAWTGWPGHKGGETLVKAAFDVIADTPPPKPPRIRPSKSAGNPHSVSAPPLWRFAAVGRPWYPVEFPRQLPDEEHAWRRRWLRRSS